MSKNTSRPLVMGLLATALLVPGFRAEAAKSHKRRVKKMLPLSRMGWGGDFWGMQRGPLALGWADGKGRKRHTARQVEAFDKCLTAGTPKAQAKLDKLIKEGGLSLSPYMKFDLLVYKIMQEKHAEYAGDVDQYSGAAQWYLNHHYIGRNKRHRFWSSRHYAGYCIGWALSQMFLPEPTRDHKFRGLIWRPADMKGISAGLLNNAQYFVEDKLVFGNEYHDVGRHNTITNREDVNPIDFQRTLQLSLDKGKPMEADLDAGDGVWNFLVTGYKQDEKQTGPRTIEATTKLYYTSDLVDRDAVFSRFKNGKRVPFSRRLIKDGHHQPGRDILTSTLKAEFTVGPKWKGDLAKAKKAKWLGQSYDTHPDVIILGLERDWMIYAADYLAGRKTMLKEEGLNGFLHITPPGMFNPYIRDLFKSYYRKDVLGQFLSEYEAGE
jgi:hypothetical protein